MRPIFRTDRRAVAPVVAEILLVAIAVVLAAVIYIMASGLLSSPTTNRPFVGFGGVTFTKGNASFAVASASIDLTISNYRFSLSVNGTAAGASVYFGASGVPASIAVGTATYRVTWTDVGGTGKMETGSTITVAGAGTPLPSATSFTFFLIWVSDGGSVGQEPWTTP